MSRLLDAKNIKVLFSSPSGFIRAVEGVDIHIDEGESVAIVGESGCGKSVTGLSIMRLLNSPPALLKADKIELKSEDGDIDLMKLSETELMKIRGDRISMIFQDPSSALNPVLTIGEQLDEVFIYHRGMNKREARAESVKMLSSVGIPAAADRCKQYPHELSGGMKQRVIIAIAMACKPKLMIADEPTTALDVTIQAQVLNLIDNLRRDNGTALLLITHDLGVVRNSAQRVYVMYCGKIVEEGSVDEILSNPMHPYTKGLIASVPSLKGKVDRFVQIRGNVPHPSNKPSGCYFSDRCDSCTDICKAAMPPLAEYKGRKVRCWNSKEDQK